MTQPSQKQAKPTKPNGVQSSQPDINNLTLNNSDLTRVQLSPHQEKLTRQKWSLKTKVTVWALAASMLPVLAVGTVTYYLGNQLNAEQISKARKVGVEDIVDTEAPQRQLSLLLLGTGITAALSGGISTLFAHRAIRSIQKAAALSTNIVTRLGGEIIGTHGASQSINELLVLETNMGLIKEQFLSLLWKQEADVERSQVLKEINRRIQNSLSEDDLLKTTVEAVREVLRVERVVIFRFDSDKNGNYVAESVASGLPKMLWATLSSAHFDGNSFESSYGSVRAIADIYQADLSNAYIELLERFAVKSHIVAPIYKKDQLYGLLIAHQCSKPYYWQQPEIDLLAQVATQVGFALDYTRLLEQINTKADRAQAFIDITRQIRRSINEEDVIKVTVEEVRKELSADRVIVYGFDAEWYGTVIAESVVPGFPKALRAKIKDPCFAEGYLDKYQAGRVQATNNIHKAGYNSCYINQLEEFAVKANLVAPILKDDRLFGLLIAHQCSGPRNWQQPEIDLITQTATQVGFALDHARLLQRSDAESDLTYLVIDLTRSIRRSLNEDDVLKTTVEEVRKAISADRVIFYGFDSEWYGTVMAESVIPGFPKALRAKIKDPCFAEGFVEKYQAGRVQAINNIYEAGLTDCHIHQLEQFAVKANLVAPIIKDDQLFGLLIAHQCSGPRNWQQFEINLLTQIATQVGFALDHARLLKQTDVAYHAAEATSSQQKQHKQELQRQVSELLKSSETVIQSMSTEVAINQIESVTQTYNQIQTLADSAREIFTSAQQVEIQEQQIGRMVEDEHESMNQLLDSISAIQDTVLSAATKVQCLSQPSQKLSEIVSIISQIVSQIKLQVMQTALEASRTGEAGHKFTAIADKILSLVQQLDSDIVEIPSLALEIQAQTHEVITELEFGLEQALSGTQMVVETQRQQVDMIALVTQIKLLVTQLAQAAALQSETSTSANLSIMEVANVANQTSEQALRVADSLAKLARFAEDLEKGVN
ncbi:MAG: GAF domain-containing protein [Rhizonema sp. NSF051]|nr:GAF domain-containing protein [Rhizonema sp. NSF051]